MKKLEWKYSHLLVAQQSKLPKPACSDNTFDFFLEKINLKAKFSSSFAHNFFLFKILESFLWGHWYPWFGLLMTSPLGFKARVDPSLACFTACVPWIPEIHLWCDTCWLYRGHHGGQPRSLHATYGRLPGFDRETSRIISGHAVHNCKCEIQRRLLC